MQIIKKNRDEKLEELDKRLKDFIPFDEYGLASFPGGALDSTPDCCLFLFNISLPLPVLFVILIQG